MYTQSAIALISDKVKQGVATVIVRKPAKMEPIKVITNKIKGKQNG